MKGTHANVVVVVTLMLGACSSLTSDVEEFAQPVCAPKEQKACTCLDSLEAGVQVCDADGSTFGDCACGPGGAEGEGAGEGEGEGEGEGAGEGEGEGAGEGEGESAGEGEGEGAGEGEGEGEGEGAGEGEGEGEACVPSLEVCDGISNDCDDEIDEIEWGVPDQLTVVFAEGSLIHPSDTLTLIAADGGHTVLPAALSGHEVTVAGNGFSLRLVSDATDELAGFAIAEVRDGAGNVMPGPYAQSDHPYPPDLERIYGFEFWGNLGQGEPCGTDQGECASGVVACPRGLGVNVCEGEDRGGAEICDGLDNDCDASVDAPLEAPACDVAAVGVCIGAVKRCGGVAGWVDCGQVEYGDDWEPVEATTDCLDNDCDGAVDVDAGGDPMVLSLGAAPQGGRRACTITESALEDDHRRMLGGAVPSGEYRFGSLSVPQGVSLRVQEDGHEAEGLLGGWPGGRGREQMHAGGGHLRIRAASIDVAGAISASARGGYGDPRQMLAGGSGGDVWLYADDIDVSGALRADGGWGRPWGSGNSGGGGAGGSLMLMAQRVSITGGIHANGGRAIDDRSQAAPASAGEGAGGTGGNRPSGTEDGGGGAGGPGMVGGQGQGGIGDPSRPLRIAGALTLGEAAVIETRKGHDGPCNGILELWGEAALHASDARLCADPIVVRRIAVRLRSPGGEPLAGLHVAVLTFGGVFEDPVDDGFTDAFGWFSGDGALIDGNEYVVIVTSADGAAPPMAGEGFVSLGDALTSVSGNFLFSWAGGEDVHLRFPLDD